MPTAFPRRAKHAWLRPGPHPQSLHSAPTPVAVPVFPETPSRLVQLSEETTRFLPRADGQRAAVPQSLLESPADFATCAPNFRKLGQAGRARQDLVRESESTTKYGDSGEESCGGCVSIGHRFEIRKASGAAAASFSPDNPLASPEGARTRAWNSSQPTRPVVPWSAARSPICHVMAGLSGRF